MKDDFVYATKISASVLSNNPERFQKNLKLYKKYIIKEVFDAIEKSKVDNFGNCGCIKEINIIKRRFLGEK